MLSHVGERESELRLLDITTASTVTGKQFHCPPAHTIDQDTVVVCVCVCIVGVPNPQWWLYLPSDTVNSLRIFLAAVVRLEHLCAKFASGEIWRRHRVIPIQKCFNNIVMRRHAAY
jgi:hypothetical protein